MFRHLPIPAIMLLLPAARPPFRPRAPTAVDTIQAGDHRIDGSRMGLFSVVRDMTLTRGGSALQFGHQSERLVPDTFAGRPAWLDVLTFDTPRGLTVDSSWIDPRTMAPLRLLSSNQARAIDLVFDGPSVRGRTVPSTGAPTTMDRDFPVRPFEWNTFALAISALPLGPGYRVVMPVYSDRFGEVTWYTVEVVRKTTLTRRAGFAAPMWEVVATPASTGPTATFWISRQHRFVDRSLLAEPGIRMEYARRR